MGGQDHLYSPVIGDIWIVASGFVVCSREEYNVAQSDYSRQRIGQWRNWLARETLNLQVEGSSPSCPEYNMGKIIQSFFEEFADDLL